VGGSALEGAGAWKLPGQGAHAWDVRCSIHARRQWEERYFRLAKPEA
jgi:hypothetical protein